MLKPLEIPPLTAEELEALEKLYRTTKEVRLRTRAQIVLSRPQHQVSSPDPEDVVRAAAGRLVLLYLPT